MRRSYLVLFVLALVLVAENARATDLGSHYRNLYTSVVTLVTEGRTIDRKRTGFTAAEGLGSGVLIDGDGLILTASHVVQVADVVGVVFAGGESVPATVVSTMPQADLALVRADSVPSGIKSVQLADSSSVEAGNEIFVIGAPYGLHSTITSGIVSARYAPGANPRFWLAEMIQIDAAVNRGSSGGPVFDAKGRCIGIVSHLKTTTGGFEGHAFAVTTNTAKKRLLGKPGIWSGMSGKMLTEDLAWAFNLPEAQGGFLVERIASGSLGSSLGLIAGTIPARIRGRDYLLGGDVILRINGIPVWALKDRYDELLQSLKANADVTVAVMRGGMVMDLVGPLQLSSCLHVFIIHADYTTGDNAYGEREHDVTGHALQCGQQFGSGRERGDVPESQRGHGNDGKIQRVHKYPGFLGKRELDCR